MNIVNLRSSGASHLGFEKSLESFTDILIRWIMRPRQSIHSTD